MPTPYETQLSGLKQEGNFITVCTVLYQFSVAVADNAGIFVERFRSGWMLKFGHRKRWFKKLKEIWLILTSEDWQLSELFPNKVTLIPPIERKVKPRFRPRPWLTPYPKYIQWWHRDTADLLNLWDQALVLQNRANHQGKILSAQQQEVLEHLL